MSDTAKTIFYIVLALLLIVPFVVICITHGEAELVTGFDKFFFFAAAILVLALWGATLIDDVPATVTTGVMVACGLLAALCRIGENDDTVARLGALFVLLLSIAVFCLYMAFMHNFPTVWAAIYALVPIACFFVLPAALGNTREMEKLVAPLVCVAIAGIPVALLVDKLCDFFSGVIPAPRTTRTISFSSVENAVRAFNRTSTKCVGGVKCQGNRIIVQVSGINGYSASGWEQAAMRAHLESWFKVNLDRTNISVYHF